MEPWLDRGGHPLEVDAWAYLASHRDAAGQKTMARSKEDLVDLLGQRWDLAVYDLDLSRSHSLG